MVVVRLNSYLRRIKRKIAVSAFGSVAAIYPSINGCGNMTGGSNLSSDNRNDNYSPANENDNFYLPPPPQIEDIDVPTFPTQIPDFDLPEEFFPQIPMPCEECEANLSYYNEWNDSIQNGATWEDLDDLIDAIGDAYYYSDFEGLAQIAAVSVAHNTGLASLAEEVAWANKIFLSVGGCQYGCISGSDNDNVSIPPSGDCPFAVDYLGSVGNVTSLTNVLYKPDEQYTRFEPFTGNVELVVQLDHGLIDGNIGIYVRVDEPVLFEGYCALGTALGTSQPSVAGYVIDLNTHDSGIINPITDPAFFPDLAQEVVFDLGSCETGLVAVIADGPIEIDGFGDNWSPLIDYSCEE
mgnify:FL=1